MQVTLPGPLSPWQVVVCCLNCQLWTAVICLVTHSKRTWMRLSNSCLDVCSVRVSLSWVYFTSVFEGEHRSVESDTHWWLTVQLLMVLWCQHYICNVCNGHLLTCVGWCCTTSPWFNACSWQSMLHLQWLLAILSSCAQQQGAHVHYVASLEYTVHTSICKCGTHCACCNSKPAQTNHLRHA